MATQDRIHIRIPGKKLSSRIALGCLAGALLCALLLFLFVGRWLVTQDPLKAAQAIAVLSGRMPMRAIEAAKLYRDGYAPKIWLTYSSEPGATLASMGIRYEGEDFYNLQVLEHEGVPAGAIRVLQPPIVNTADEMAAISAEMAKERDGTVIIVTSKAHTRRARILWDRIAAGRQLAIMRAASTDPFDAVHWWRTTRDALDVVREFLGILNAWAGLPIHPAR